VVLVVLDGQGSRAYPFTPADKELIYSSEVPGLAANSMLKVDAGLRADSKGDALMFKFSVTETFNEMGKDPKVTQGLIYKCTRKVAEKAHEKVPDKAPDKALEKALDKALDKATDKVATDSPRGQAEDGKPAEPPASAN
jgi:hypothetical protein